MEAHEEFGVVWDEVRGGSEQGLEEGPAFLAIAREQRSDTPEQGAFGPVGERPDEIGEDLALGLEPDDRVRVEGLTDGHLVRQRLRDGPVLADAFVQVLDLRAQCVPMGLGSVGRGKEASKSVGSDGETVLRLKVEQAFGVGVWTFERRCRLL